MKRSGYLLLGSLLLPGTGVAAGNADVLAVDTTRTGPETWTFRVTVEHADIGWKDYADGWDVVLPDGTVVKPNPQEAFTRTLWHPHVDEQPFTRSQSGIRIPAGTPEVRVRAHDLRDGFGGRELTVKLSGLERSGLERPSLERPSPE